MADAPTVTRRTLLSVRDVATYLNVPPKTIHEWCRKDLLPGIKLGRFWRFDPEEIRKFIASQPRGSTGRFQSPLA